MKKKYLDHLFFIWFLETSDHVETSPLICNGPRHERVNDKTSKKFIML